MSPSIIKSKQSQLKIFQELHENLKKRFSSSEKSDHYDFLRGYKGSDDFAKFGLDFWMRHDWVGISLWGPPINGSADSKNALGFATYSPRSPIGSTAGALARDTRKLDKAAPYRRQGRMASERTVSACWLHHHQHGAASRKCRRLLQQARHVRTMDQGGQGRDPMDPSFLPLFRRERGPPPTLRARLPAYAGDACRPFGLDLISIATSVKLAQASGKPFFVVTNAAPVQGVETAEAVAW